jgi:arylsulfatase A-like enzyme
MFGPPRTSDVSPIHRFLSAPRKDLLDEATIRAEMDQYDGAIAYLDDQLGRLFAELESRHLLDSTVVLVSADHGEEFGEHGVFDHGNSLYRPSVQVPLLVVYPPAVPAGRIISDPVTLRDVAATLADLAGVPQGTLPGTSLARFWLSGEGPQGDSQSPVISEVSKGIRTPAWYPVSKGDMRSLAGLGHRYILNGDDAEQLFVLDDEWERQPVAVTDSLAAPFRRELTRWPWRH